MPFRAKCKDCTWKCRSESESFVRFAAQAHSDNQRHRTKIKEL
ncbi:hypothetical protein TURBIDO_83 [Mycobacterium phage Turbido]|uniref:Uncharacterized protein n=7 Tax=Turbidovirus turbido TaxID=1993865 RepID=A0A1D8EZQ2_9CAUD|nr:hypothetical protein TURBIDO_83 [Mycobacterium phage Turbido]AOT27734.1 hypothetical protein SEA_JERM_84 [Mycobacterium phage Jerm]AWH13600.1 hypothetical protein SEA_ABBYPAIGE_84 [Mycobacterium phage AbbyPaige]AYD86632.1 hypothetical protein SEA_LILTURB_83 [Mycobacterium phage LilTurb]QBI96584.1 hypothetical protein SEA_WHABIGAIL7_82 [Mycobacterium phage Whabigail7]QUE25759.1 hypothetical protein SEA_SMEAGAN_85 [Mycobacterium phage Smeagan]QWS69813.1 hypothetical protein SEA_LEVIATHAN_84 